MATEIFDLLVSTFFYLYIIIVFLRFLFQLIKADFYNPISQFTVKATDPLLKPMAKVLPPIKNFSSSALVLIILLKLLESTLNQLIQFGTISSFYIIFSMSIIELVSMAIKFYIFAILGQIILSWIAPQNYNPVVSLLYQITDPIMTPAKKIIPPMGGMDFSPILVFIGLQILEIILVSSNGLLPTIFKAISPIFL